MLYKLAHILRDRFSFLWNLVEWGNAFVFALTHRAALKKIPAILQECSGMYTLRVAELADATALATFFAEQPEEAFKFFKPHAFDEKTLSKIIRKIVDYRYRGKGIAKLQGLAATKVASALEMRVFGTISPENYASLASSKAVNEVRIVETLENGYYYIEYLPKKDEK